ncbi:DUF2115 family protein [Methanobacterium alcaliphilum]|uniref:DUF2115 family protein n=1 Tax=Methanobacterium alcaliphilum TaxID=392018 RepID=UPI002009F32D|nr:DUF2115 family protein [Methanobacterium alcaliphilum]MCK9150870.1 DUF2115 family protein [Methanobacterium alcaliphilum]
MFENIDFSKLTKISILETLKLKAKEVNLEEIISASLFIIEDAKYVQREYREKFIESYTHAFITRITILKNDRVKYIGEINSEKFKEAILLLNKQKRENDMNKNFNQSFFKIYMIISIYTTFVLDEPIHPIGTPFPGGFEVIHDGENYLCPVKESQKDNPGAVCGFCIAEQDPSI